MPNNLPPVVVTPIQAATNNGPWDIAYGGYSSNQANSYPVVHAAIGKISFLKRPCAVASCALRCDRRAN